MNVSCAVGQRAAAAILAVARRWLPGVTDTPCANTGRMWLLRSGLYELIRAKEPANDWVWLVDHTLQLGPWKCLVVVGIRLGSWQKDRRPLEHRDLTLLNLVPMLGSTGEQVHEVLRKTCCSTGIPLEIVSDGAADLRRGVELLRETHPEIVHVNDIKHKTASFMKKELESDRQWAAFINQVNRTKKKVAQTELAFLAPPCLKGKARYLNLDTLLNWSHRALDHLDKSQQLENKVALARLESKLGWLRQYRRQLERWSQFLSIAEMTNHYIRHEGFHAQAASELARRIKQIKLSQAGQRMRCTVVTFVKKQSSYIQSENQRLIGSTEVLESLIGKYKQLQRSHSQGGMTAMLLSFGAIVCSKTQEFIRTALANVKTHDVTKWCHKNLGVTLQAQRLIAFGRNKTRIQKPVATG